MRVAVPQRWKRFSLRAMFVVVTLVCLFLGLKAKRVQRQKALIRAVQAEGGTWRYDDWAYFRPRRELVQPLGKAYGPGGAYMVNYRTVPPPKKFWLRRLLGDDWFAEVVEVRLGGPRVSNKTLAEILPQLARVDSVRELILYESSVTDDALAPLAEIEQLEELNLCRTPVKMDDPGMVQLLELRPRLKISY